VLQARYLGRKVLGANGRLMARWYRQAQRLFHMVVGLVFLGFAAAGGVVTAAEWSFYRQAPEVGLTRLVLLASFTVFLIILGLYTFLKARSVR
jgi:hypothetical protein